MQLTKFGRCEPSNIPSIRLYIWLEMRLLGQQTIHTIHQHRFQARPPSWFFKRELEKIAFKAIRKRNGWPNLWLKRNGRNHYGRISKTYCSIEEYLPLKKICLILKPCREIAQSFEESLRWGRLVKNLEILWMKNNIIIKFCSVWCGELCWSRRMLFTEAVLSSQFAYCLQIIPSLIQ